MAIHGPFKTLPLAPVPRLRVDLARVPNIGLRSRSQTMSDVCTREWADIRQSSFRVTGFHERQYYPVMCNTKMPTDLSVLFDNLHTSKHWRFSARRPVFWTTAILAPLRCGHPMKRPYGSAMTNDHWMLKGCYLRMTWLVSLSVFVAICSSCAARADDKTEVEYLLAGMLQERGKLHSGSCVIDGFERINGAYKMKYLFKGDHVRFTRTRKTASPVIEDACDNGNQIIWWDHSNSSYSIQKSVPSVRQALSIWDPHAAGLNITPA